MSWDDKIKATATDLAGKARQWRKSLPKAKRARTGRLGGKLKAA
jgi:hypothetical protein